MKLPTPNSQLPTPNSERGFSLLETIVAVGIVAVGLVSALTLLSSSVAAVTIIRERLTAANLVQEGIEVVRNIRDNNWLQNLPWNTGLANGDYRVAYNSLTIASYDPSPLLFDSGTGLYGYTSGTATSFVRKITITSISAFEMKVESRVTWNNRGRILEAAAEEHFFNWR